MKLTVIGTGYVGLVAGACFAESGNDVICMDKDEGKIRNLRENVLPIYEPGLERLVHHNTSNGRLRFTTDIREAVSTAEIIFIAVGTPSDKDGSADLSYVLEVAKTIGENMNDFKIIVNKSTVPVGTARRVRETVKKYTDFDFEVVSNPEFLKEGAAVDDFMYPDRVIIGTRNAEVAEKMRGLYQPFVRTGNPILVMDEQSAELTKYAANSILATKISFMNEMANLCDAVEADVEMVRKGIGSDKRIGYSFIFPGVGFGGSCFPKDVRAVIHTARENNCELKVLEAVQAANEEQKKILVKKILRHFDGSVAGKTFAIWGLSFKPRTDDMREAPSLAIIEALQELGAKISAHDPAALGEARRMKLDRTVQLCDNNYDALKAADGLIIVTEWLDYREPDFLRIKSELRTPVIFDGRNIYDPGKLRAMGFTYYGIGRR